MDDFKRHIKGFRRYGVTCPCCRETTKKNSRKLARHRLTQQNLKEYLLLEQEDESLVENNEIFGEQNAGDS